MAKIITFSRRFQNKHPKRGEPTFFVEQILNYLKIDFRDEKYFNDLCKWNRDKLAAGKIQLSDLEEFHKSLCKDIEHIKKHTIRNGIRFQKGEFFQPAVWSKNPYHSTQILFSPLVEVKQTHKFIHLKGDFYLNFSFVFSSLKEVIATNDGLTRLDFINWFKQDMIGQVIAWSDDLPY